ncbi:MAG: citryl-CoA lyase [Candidatus Geothermarchaeales archaeon]
MSEAIWQTAITKVEPNHLVTRGYRQEDLIGSVPFAHVIYLLLRGELPDEKRGRMMDAMIVACVDHGVTPPSCLAARAIASSGVPLPTAVAGGLSAVGDYHGGAIEECMKILEDAVSRMRSRGTPIREEAKAVVDEMRLYGRRMPGLGHRIHTNDPRVGKLFKLAGDLEVAGDHVSMLEAVRDAYTEALGRELPINVDGAVAALLADMGFDNRLGKAFFLIGRSAGLVAHVYEEMTRERPMRRIGRMEHEYDGPAERDLPERYRR